MSEIIAAYKGEALLIRWGENHNGRTVTLQLDEHVGEQHPFKSLKCGPNGQRMQIVAVLIGDDEQPIPPPSVKSTPAPQVSTPAKVATVEKHKNYTRSQIAALKLQDDDFCAFLDNVCDCEETGADNYDTLLKFHLGIKSKRELDTDEASAKRWDALLASYDYRAHVK